ncbi:MAG: cupin domain-containing protein [Verrucomicrobia bacterium]|nr:cupin domain-containing protein [Verrucomicrobiota bacterium]
MLKGKRNFFVLLAFICLGHVANVHADQQILPGGCVKKALNPIISHEGLKHFELNGNALVGVATPSMGAEQFEVWRTSWNVGCFTPKHTHETEEIFIFLKGKGRVLIGNEEFFFEAPCTVICPPGIEHQFFNAGDEPTDAIVILGSRSQIVDANQQEMKLPWRR